jgi:APA family basic amino acid/polyamine antiporter
VLVPVANPQSAPALVAVAGALAPPDVGRVLLLSVVRRPERLDDPAAVRGNVGLAQEVLHEALAVSLVSGHIPEALMTVSPVPWTEIARVARIHDCESLLLGLHRLDEPTDGNGAPLEQLLNEVDCDVSILRALPDWRLEEARRILIPVGGKGAQDALRARLLGSLCRTASRELTFLQILPAGAPEDELEETRRDLLRLAVDETRGTASPEALVVRADDVVAAIAEHAARSDLVVLGLPRVRGRKLLGELALRIARQVSCPTIMISRRG